jgi:hypothetical protein
MNKVIPCLIGFYDKLMELLSKIDLILIGVMAMFGPFGWFTNSCIYLWSRGLMIVA